MASDWVDQAVKGAVQKVVREGNAHGLPQATSSF
eukprot:CAMPEP_0195118788 /NCGR_PEP_ID=MMETSP0448-20130528/117887_1 /TAXON_ID=66468 /ORGANISM="Heterocapsa triquestra, Strain CCMP 448" /LENGTH=33 /DNA_ID= /DNA_START= /DNA_END= /DNA_ORIENTATION=